MEYPPIELKVWGDFACFTRPELKVERVSYDVMTPSAARGVLEAIFWKPQFSWRVREIRVLRPVRYFSIVRNEVTKRTAYSTARKWEEANGHFFADDLDEEKNRSQRHTLALRDVAYIIVADVALQPSVAEDPAKFRDQFRRRAAHGQCHTMPYLGCREFSASFEPPDGTERPIDRSVDLGRMLFDLDYAADGSGRGQPRFFAARLERGVLRVPSSLYEGGR